MSPYKITALVHLKAVIITSDGTERGTVIEGLTTKEEAVFRSAATRHDSIRIGDGPGGAVATASYDKPLGAVAALHVAGRGNVRILRAPRSVAKVIPCGIWF